MGSTLSELKANSDSLWPKCQQIFSKTSHIRDCVKQLFSKKPIKPKSQFISNSNFETLNRYINDFNLHDPINLALAVCISLFVLTASIHLILYIFSLLQKHNLKKKLIEKLRKPRHKSKIAKREREELRSEEERFERNIPRLYYGFYRLLKCVIHPALFEYIAATYFKKELKHSTSSAEPDEEINEQTEANPNGLNDLDQFNKYISGKWFDNDQKPPNSSFNNLNESNIYQRKSQRTFHTIEEETNEGISPSTNNSTNTFVPS